VGSRVNVRFVHLFLAFENYCVTVNTDTPIPQQPPCRSGTHSFWQYKYYAGIRRGSREKQLQTTVGSRAMRASIALYAEVYALCVTN